MEAIKIVQKKGPVSDKIKSLLQYRIEQEELSSRIYLAMSMWLNNNGYMGAAKLWKKYSDEEQVHADKAKDTLLAFGVQPDTPLLPKPNQTFQGLPDIVRKSYDHEVDVTNQCQELAKAAMNDGNMMVMDLGLWYSREQVEELDKMQTWLDKLTAFGEDKIAMRLLDEEMGED